MSVLTVHPAIIAGRARRATPVPRPYRRYRNWAALAVQNRHDCGDARDGCSRENVLHACSSNCFLRAIATH